MKVKRLDHLVLTVKNITDTCHFYTSVLGMEEITFAEGRKALTFGDQKITVHEYGKKFEPNALKPTPGSADLCFIPDSHYRCNKTFRTAKHSYYEGTGYSNRSKRNNHLRLCSGP